MQAPKLHLLKQFQGHLKGHTHVLILGPLAISEKLLNKTLRKISPTLILLIDGGEKHKNKLSSVYQKCTLTLGDGDSSPKTPLLLLNKEKDFSDLAFAFYGMKKAKIQWKSVTLLGFSSEKEEKRPDHFLFNLGEIYEFVKKFRLKICMDDRFLFLPAGENSFEYKGVFSVIALEKTSVRISGKAKFTLPQWTTLGVLSSHGLSNRAFGQVKIAHKKPVIIYFAGTKTSS